MSKTLPAMVAAIYLALACLISGIFACTSASGAVYSLIALQVPEVDMYRYNTPPIVCESMQENTRCVSEEEAKAQEEAEFESTYFRTLQNLIENTITLLIAALAFAFHWPRLRAVWIEKTAKNT